MAVAFVQSVVGTQTSATGTSVDAASITPSNGNWLLAFVYMRNMQAGSVTMSGGGLTWTEVARRDNGASDGFTIGFKASVSGSPGAFAPSCTYSDGSKAAIVVLEYSGVDSVGASNTSFNIGNIKTHNQAITTTVANTVIVGGAGAAVVWGSGDAVDTFRNSADTAGLSAERSAMGVSEKAVATASADDISWSSTAFHSDIAGVVVELKPAAAGTTVTPAVIPTTTTVPAPTPTGAGKATPAAVATTSSLPGPTPLGEALTQPGAVATTTTAPTPTITIGKTVTPTVIATVASIPTPTPLGEALVTVAVIPTTTTVPTPTPSIPETVTPAGIGTVSTVPTPTPQGGGAASPVVILTTVTIPTPTPFVPSGATVTPAVVATVSALSAPTPIGGTVVSPALIETLIDILVPLVGVPAVDIEAPSWVQFQRIGSTLVLAEIGRGGRRGFQTGEGFERVSEVFTVDNQVGTAGHRDRAMVSVSSVWAVNAGASAAVLKAAINQALQTAGFRTPGGGSLV